MGAIGLPFGSGAQVGQRVFVATNGQQYTNQSDIPPDTQGTWMVYTQGPMTRGMNGMPQQQLILAPTSDSPTNIETEGPNNPMDLYQTWASEGMEDPRDAVVRLQAEYEKDPSNTKLARQLDDAKKRADTLTQMDEVYNSVVQTTRDWLSGNVKLPEGMATQINESIERVRAPLEGLLAGLEGKVRNTANSMRSAIQDYATQVKNTGSSILQEVNTAAEKARQYHQEAISNNRALADLNLTEVNEDLTKQMMFKAATLGRATTDPEFQKELQKDLMKVRSASDLQIAGMDIQGRQNISLAEMDKRLAVAERTGAGLEQSKLMLADVAGQEGSKLEQVQGQRISLNENLLKQGEQMRWDWINQAPARAQGGAAGIEAMNRYTFGIPMERVTAVMGPMMGYQTPLLQQRMAETTTTTTTTPSWGQVFGQAVGLGLQGAGMGMGFSQGNKLIGALTTSKQDGTV